MVDRNGSSESAPQSDQRGELSTQFDKSISLVQDFTSRLELDYVRPGFKSFKSFFARRPLSAAFIAIFSLLSFFPVITFIGFSLFISVIFVIAAFSAAFIASATVILGLLVVLSIVLIVTFFAALFLTACFVSAFSFLRFATLLRKRGFSGVLIWAEETKDHIIGILQPTDGHSHIAENILSDSISDSKAQKADSRASDPSDEEPYSDWDVKVQGQ